MGLLYDSGIPAPCQLCHVVISATTGQLSQVRIRLPELFKEHDMTAYGIARDSAGRILPSTLYRLARQRGRVKYFDSELLEALCDVLDVEPGDLFEREEKRRGRSTR